LAKPRIIGQRCLLDPPCAPGLVLFLTPLALTGRSNRFETMSGSKSSAPQTASMRLGGLPQAFVFGENVTQTTHQLPVGPRFAHGVSTPTGQPCGGSAIVTGTLARDFISISRW
jgi:hypothetical protein